jgi:hypothetical protein
MEKKFNVGDEVVYEGILCKVKEARQEWVYDLEAVHEGVEIVDDFYAIPEENVGEPRK